MSNAVRKMMLFALVMLLGSLGAMAQADEPTQVPASKTSDYPASYDQKVATEISKAPGDQFTYPTMTVLHPVPTQLCSHDCQAAFVWLKVRIDKSHNVSESKVAYCSTPNDGFEEVAQKVVAAQKLSCPDGNGSCDRWLWHQVVFTGDESLPSCDSSGLPRPDEFIAVEKAPELIFASRPDYPSEAKRNGQTGVVWVKSLVDKAGLVRMAMVLKSCGHPLLDNAAVMNAWRNVYKPAEMGGVPVAIWVSYKVEYELNE
jgi:TonB family protein